MKFGTLLTLFLSLLISCQNKNNKFPQIQIVKDAKDSFSNFEKNKEKILKSTIIYESQSTHGLNLTANALQVINKKTGSTLEIPFGKSFDEMIEMINNILQSKPTSLVINAECGAGPLKMASWNNGLTVVFQKKTTQAKESEAEWKFAGWFIGKNSTNSQNIFTMAGIGIGSTRADMESTYMVKVNKTSLGYEF